MKLTYLIAGVLFSLTFFSQSSVGIEIEGGRIEDVVVAPSQGYDRTVVTTFSDGYYPRGPNSLDVDKDGNIYILDWLGARIQKYHTHGKFIKTITILEKAQYYKLPPQIHDITVDNEGNLYVTGQVVPTVPFGMMKFSPEGRFLWQIPNKEVLERGDLGHAIQYFVLTDKSGRVYNYALELDGGFINVYNEGGQFQKEITPGFSRYFDKGRVQKEVGNDIFSRVDKYLLRSSLEEYVASNKIDTVAILPDWTRLREYADDKGREEGWVEYPLILIGFDRNEFFYFHQIEDWAKDRTRGMCLIHHLYRFHLEKHSLIRTGEIKIYFARGKPECSDKELFQFQKQFIVTGDGIIYFLHGTVDTVKVSKITMEESGNSE